MHCKLLKLNEDKVPIIRYHIGSKIYYIGNLVLGILIFKVHNFCCMTL